MPSSSLISTRCCTLKTYLGTITLLCAASKVTELEKRGPPSVPFNCLVNFEVSQCVHPRAGAARIQFGENTSVSHWLVRDPGLSSDWIGQNVVKLPQNLSQVIDTECAFLHLKIIIDWIHLQSYDFPPRFRSLPRSRPFHWGHSCVDKCTFNWPSRKR